MNRTRYDPFETRLNALQSRRVESHVTDSLRFEHPSPCLPTNPMVIGTQVATAMSADGGRSVRMAAMIDTDSSLRGLSDPRRAVPSAAPSEVEVLPRPDAGAGPRTVPAEECGDAWTFPSLDLRRMFARGT